MKKLFFVLLVASSIISKSQSTYLLSSNGINQYVDCGNGPALKASSIKTMECWVKFNYFTGSQAILAKSEEGAGVELLILDGNLSAYFMNGSDYSFVTYPVSNLKTGVWYHTAITRDGVDQ